MRIPLADRSVHCVVTSPPYFGLRDYGVEGQIGLEPTPDAFVASMVRVFREVWRVMRDDATLWLNLGDSYAGGGGGNYSKSPKQIRHGEHITNVRNRDDWLSSACLKPKDLIGIPWRVALALQADGWYLRGDVIWSKPAPMTESVRDRPSKSHEYIFLLTKKPRYFYDIDAIREPLSDSSVARGNYGHNSIGKGQFRGSPTDARHQDGKRVEKLSELYNPLGRNKRSVWRVSSRGYKGAHFATFPPALIEPCVLAGTSAKGCCRACGAPWRRLVVKSRSATRPGTTSKVHAHDGDSAIVGNRDPFRHVTTTATVGWEPSCKCEVGDPAPCTVLDPFNGAATTGLVALMHGRRYVGIDLKSEYLAMSAERLSRPHAPKPKRPSRPKPDRTPSLFGAFQK
jgi:DNA modification methylase